jgi:mono/diheme cytochrome c family protein
VRLRGNWLAAALLSAATLLGCATLPEYRAPDSVTYAGQNWTEQQRQWFYHASQGTKLMPYAWFLALEQPQPSLFGTGRFAAADYLARFGFLPDAPSPDNPDALPVGFARDTFGEAEGSSARQTFVGLTCAACHTGQIEYGRRALRIDGGPALIDTSAFQAQLGIAMLLTVESDPRFARFAGRVLGTPEAPDTSEARERLRAELRAGLILGLDEREQGRRAGLYPVAEGAGRLDALGRGGNFVFGSLMGDARNFAVANAPVSFPPIWDAPWFDWVQYNGSIRQPMGRNVAEAMGVRSLVRMEGPPENLYRSSVRIRRIHEMERQIAGDAPGTGLHPPSWPEDMLGPIDRAAASRGQALYESLCAGCHAGRWTAPQATAAGSPPQRYLALTMVPLDRIGTDPRAAENFRTRTAYPSRTDTTPMPAFEGLRRATDAVIGRWYTDNAIPPELRREMDGYRANDWRAPAAYRARPLNGMWATAPYLHNGSVPSLYQLLLPAERRDRVFTVGSRQFDPRHLGFSTVPYPGGFVFDTDVTGNSNRGHEFRDGPRGNGVIGPALTDEQRLDLIEFLKTL